MYRITAIGREFGSFYTPLKELTTYYECDQDQSVN